jgi:hypothetical protein
MHTLEQIEEEVRQLPAAEQKALLAKLARFVAGSNGSETMAGQAPLTRFFAEWDAKHSMTVGEQPTRERTYAGNPRLR